MEFSLDLSGITDSFGCKLLGGDVLEVYSCNRYTCESSNLSKSEVGKLIEFLQKVNEVMV